MPTWPVTAIRPCSASQPAAGGDVDRVHGSRVNPDPHLAGGEVRDGEVSDLQDLRSSEAADDYGSHLMSLPGSDPLPGLIACWLGSCFARPGVRTALRALQPMPG